MDRVMKVYEFIKDFWLIIKKNINVPANNDLAAWDDLVDAGNGLYKKYGDDSAEGRFCKACVMAWLDYLNERCKGGLEC